ncbi:hypothetical protein DA717_09375 [Piscirickettsiaceae bacterium NZ-RLO2]|nr:hypothetical protein DA717_09375 [Piscirickettsiaceae bacterium NZ-RLO2]
MKLDLINNSRLKAILILILVFLYGYDSFAAETTSYITNFSQMSENWQQQFNYLSVFAQFICSISGIFVIIVGIFKLKPASPSGQQQSTARLGLIYLLIGSGLLGIGPLISVIANTGSGEHIIIRLHRIFSPVNNNPKNIFDGIIVYFLMPFFKLAEVASPIAGIATLCVAGHRLRYHSNPQMMAMHRRSPMATAFYFLAGSLLMAPFFIIQDISESLFNTPSVLKAYCGTGDSGDFLSYFNNLDAQTVITYANGTFNCVASTSSSLSLIDNITRLTYAVLFVVGFIAVIRGVFLFIKIGEHMGGPNANLSKIVAHVIGGFCAMNANMLTVILINTYYAISGLPPTG